MILAGESLAKLTRVFSQLIVEASEDRSVLRYRNFLKGRSIGGRPVFVDGESPTAESQVDSEENAA